MVQTRNRHKRMPACPAENVPDRIEHTAHDHTGCFIDTRERRGVTTIQITITTGRLPDNARDIGRRVEAFNDIFSNRHGRTLHDTLIQTGGLRQ